MADIAINPVTRRVQFTGNTGTGPFAFTFNILQASDIVVYKNNNQLTLTTDYSVTINANGTGSITLVSALVATDVLIILGGRELSRTTDFVTSGDLLAASLNEQLDSNVIMSQQLDERVSRALRVQPGDESADLYLPLKSTRQDKILSFDSSGNVAVKSASELSSGTVLGANYVLDTAAGDGSRVAFTVSADPGSQNNIQIYIDGVYQNKAGFSVNGTTVTFTEAPPLNSNIEFITGSAITSVTAGDASGMTYTQGSTGSVQRTAQSKFQEIVSVKDFGAIAGSAVYSSTNLAAFHSAMQAAKTVYVPEGIYYVSGPVQIQQAGQRLLGAQVDYSGGSGIYPDFTDDNTIETDSLSDVEIANLFIYVRGSSGVGYYHAGGAWLDFHDCTIYNPTASEGTGIVLDDRNLAGTFVPGSYIHTIRRVNMARGNYLATGIKTAGTSGGINASRIQSCHIISDNCIEWNYGGGNIIEGNLLQTSTGTIGTPAGKGYNAVNAGSNMLVGNYMEKFAYDVYNGSTVTGGAPIVSNHHTDNSTAVNGFGGGSSTMPFFVDQNGVHNLTLYENSVAVTANSQAIPTNQAVIRIAGNGAHRSSCTLSTDNARDGQMLYVRGDSWSVQILESTTADFGPYGSNDGLIFGTAGASISIGGITRPLMKSALFMYRSSSSKWELLEATAHRQIGGNFENIDVTANGTAINTDAAKIFITGAGAARSNCTLEAPVVDGQSLTILATSWAVTIIPSTTAVFASAASSVTFSGTTSDVMSMNLIGYNGKWYESGRAVT